MRPWARWGREERGPGEEVPSHSHTHLFCMCLCVMHVCAHMCICVRGYVQMLLRTAPPNMRVSLAWNSTSGQGWLATEPQGSSCQGLSTRI